MPIPITCTECKHNIKAPDRLEGRRIKCPECGTSLLVEAPRRKNQFLDDDDDDRVKVLRVESVDKESRSSLPGWLGIFALFQGISAIAALVMYAKFPQGLGRLASFAGMSAAGLGTFLGLIGIVVAASKKNGMLLPLSGGLTSLIALVGLIAWPMLSRQMEPKQTEIPIAESKQTEDPLPKETKKGEPPPKVEWTDASKNVARLGNVQVKVKQAVIGNVNVKPVIGAETRSEKLFFAAQLEVVNMSKNRKLDFKGWSGAAPPPDPSKLLGGLGKGDLSALASLGGNPGTLADDVGNTYNRFTGESALGETIDGQVSQPVSIYPGKSVDDLVIFEEPVTGIKALLLELPAAAFGESGTIRFRIPMSMIRRK